MAKKSEDAAHRTAPKQERGQQGLRQVVCRAAGPRDHHHPRTGKAHLRSRKPLHRGRDHRRALRTEPLHPRAGCRGNWREARRTGSLYRRQTWRSQENHPTPWLSGLGIKIGAQLSTYFIIKKVFIYSMTELKDCSNLSDILQTLHKRLVLHGFLHIVVCLEANPYRGWSTQSSL